MTQITLQGQPFETIGSLPQVDSKAPDFHLTAVDLSTKSLGDFSGKTVVLNIFPSVDTGTCAQSVRQFNEVVSTLNNTVVLCISKDLPFAQKRFCGAEGLENVVMLSEYKDFDFSNAYEVTIKNGPLQGLMSRSVVVINTSGEVIYTEQVKEIADEPNYEKVVETINS